MSQMRNWSPKVWPAKVSPSAARTTSARGPAQATTWLARTGGPPAQDTGPPALPRRAPGAARGGRGGRAPRGGAGHHVGGPGGGPARAGHRHALVVLLDAGDLVRPPHLDERLGGDRLVAQLPRHAPRAVHDRP